MAESDPEDMLPRAVSRTAQVADRLRRDILGGQVRPGERLPTELGLIARFGVSRTVVREALAALRSEGLVVSRQGAGVFVSGDPTGAPFRIVSDELHSLTEVEHVLQLRLAVEVEAAGLAAEHRSRGDLLVMQACLDRIDAAIVLGETAVSEDLGFHCALSAATGNPYFERFMRFLGPMVIPRQTIRVGLDTRQAVRDYVTLVQAEHRRIFAAVRRRDREAARAELRAHLEAGRDRYRRLTGRATADATRRG